MAVADFKITDAAPRAQYVATNGQTDFVIPFRFFEDGDIEVRIDDATNPELSSTYTVSGAGTNANGTLSFLSGRTAGDIVTITRNSSIERIVNFIDSGDWTAQNVNDQLNRLTTYIQEVALKAIDLAVTLPVTTTLSGLSFPAGGVGFENRVIGFNAAGDDLTAGPTFDELEDWSDDAEAAAAQATLDAAATAADRIAVAADKAVVAADKAIVASDKTAAQTAATNAAASEVAADADRVTVAADKAIVAADKATVAADKATTEGYKNTAQSSATTASAAQVAAEAARDATLAAFDSFDDRYLGAKASDPTLDNDGNALVAGSLYYNTTANEMRVYTGSAWVAAYVSGTGYLATANNLSDLANAATARTNLGLGALATLATVAAAQIASNAVTPVKVDTTVTAISAGSGTKTVDLSTTARSFTLTVSGGTNTLVFSSPKATGNEDIFTLRLTNGGSRTVNWPASVDWAGGVAPTLTAAGVDEFVFKTVDGGTTWVGARLLDAK